MPARVSPSSLASFGFPSFALLALTLGCASPQSTGNPGSGGSGSPGAAGAQGSGGSGSPGTAGSQGSAGTQGGGGSGAPACTPNPNELASPSGWNCNLNETIAIQGSIYAYGDGSSCTLASSNPCSAGGCCISGTTVVDTTFAKWGCGIGMELSSSGGTNPTKSVYTGPVRCFDITLTGSSGGNVVRIGFTQSPTPAAGAVAPFTEIPPFTNGWSGEVCFADVTCPSWAVMAGTCMKEGERGTPVDLQVQVSAGSTTATTGAYNVCITSIKPVVDPGSVGTTNSCSSVSGTGTITDRYGSQHVTCNGKDYIVQNNAWGSAAGQTITYGPGTKFKVTVQNGTGSNGAPASYPSVWTGAYNNRSTTGSGLPRAVSSIQAGSLSTSLTWADNGATGDYNAAYDVWFSTGSGGDPSASAPSGGYLMVWFYDPPVNQPIGTAMATASIGGRNWSVWYGMNGSRPCVSYVAQQKITSLTFSLGDFVRDAVTRNYVQNSWYLTAIFGGFEIWSGGVGIEVKDFAVTVP